LSIPVVPTEELERLWSDNQMPDKRASSIFTEIVAWQVRASDPALPNVSSRIIKLLTAKGRHIGTVHDIVNENDGNVLESRPHDYTFRDCSRVRRIQKQEEGT